MDETPLRPDRDTAQARQMLHQGVEETRRDRQFLFARELRLDTPAEFGPRDLRLRLVPLYGAVVAAQQRQAAHVADEDGAAGDTPVHGLGQNREKIVDAGKILHDRIEH
jgi:hypothetical protein